MITRKVRSIVTVLITALFAGSLFSLTFTLHATPLNGKVVCEDGVGLPGIEIQIYNQLDETCDAGEFSFEELPTGPALLRITGEDGTGQVRVHVEQNNESIEFVYPVVTEIVILHDNDLHFNYHQTEEFTAKVNRMRKDNPNVFLMNAGDTFVRHRGRWPIDNKKYYAKRSRLIIETMNRVGYDVMTMGNHEMEHIGDHTKTALERARFPLLAANTEVKTDKLPPLKPYIIMETDNGRTLAVVGLTCGKYTTEPIETAENYERLAEENDLFVALTHIGHGGDKRLARSLDFIDVIVGGHCHTMLEKAVHENGTLIAQAGGHSHRPEKNGEKYLGVIRLTLQNGQLVESKGEVKTIK